jgi:hypothetical protein
MWSVRELGGLINHVPTGITPLQVVPHGVPVRVPFNIGDKAREGGFLKVIPTVVRASRRVLAIVHLTHIGLRYIDPYKGGDGRQGRRPVESSLTEQ